MRSYPYTIENGAGEKLTFARRVANGRGDRLEGENQVAPGSGPPMHVHHLQDEALTLVGGRLGYQVAGQQPVFAEEGETVVFRAGQAHRFWNAGETELRCNAYIEPAGNVEFFLESIFNSQKENAGRRSDVFDSAYLTRKYRSEFGMLAVPPVGQSLLFPLLIAIGRVLGSTGSMLIHRHPSSGRRRPTHRSS